MKTSKIKVLIAEDDDITILLLKMILRNVVSEVVIAKNGKEAVEKFKKQRDIQLVLMDIMMPEMNGFEATRRIRKQDNSVVIIAQTALVSTLDKEMAMCVGCNEYINKPINKTALIELIQNYFDLSHILRN
ncbi:MAG TPA: response regulator [Bacteroidales bacterium]|nr:response regulator [Bacteroidales bacterium]